MAKLDFRTGDLTRSIGELTGVYRGSQRFIRRRVTPSDPQTADQLQYRSNMSKLSSIVRQIATPLIIPYTRPKLRRTSALFHLTRLNKVALAKTGFLYPQYKYSEGSLYNPGIGAIYFSWGSRMAQMYWDVDLMGEGSDSDILCCFIWVETLKKAYFYLPVTRGSGFAECQILEAAQGLQLRHYIFFASQSRCSPTAYSTFSVPAP